MERFGGNIFKRFKFISVLRGDRDSLCSAFKLAKNGHRDREDHQPKPNITFGPPAPTLPAAASPNLFPFNLYHNLLNGSAAGLLGSSLGAFNPMLALAAQHSPLLASAYANLGVNANGMAPSAPSVDRLRQQSRFSPYEGSNGSAFDTVLPRGGCGSGGGVSPPTHRPPLSPASVCSSTSSFHQTSSDLLSIERMVKGIDSVKNNNHLSDDQLSEKGGGGQSPRSESHWKAPELWYLAKVTLRKMELFIWSSWNNLKVTFERMKRGYQSYMLICLCISLQALSSKAVKCFRRAR